VASPVGANREVVIKGETGFFADSSKAWVESLAMLLGDADLRQKLGQAGRVRVEAEYSLQRVAPQLTTFLKKAVR